MTTRKGVLHLQVLRCAGLRDPRRVGVSASVSLHSNFRLSQDDPGSAPTVFATRESFDPAFLPSSILTVNVPRGLPFDRAALTLRVWNSQGGDEPYAIGASSVSLERLVKRVVGEEFFFGPCKRDYRGGF